MKNLIIYHKADYDGTLSRDTCLAWLKHCYPNDTTDSVGWDYGDPVPSIESYDTIYLVDISIPEILVSENRDKVIWIDHHKTAIERYGDNWNGVRIDGVAACRLCWQWFFTNGLVHDKNAFIDRDVVEPLLIRLAGEYDVWDKRDPDAEVLQYGLRAIPSFDAVEHLTKWIASRDNADTYRLLNAGRGVRAYAEHMNSIIARRGHDIVWEGITFHVINTATGNSLTHQVAIKPEHQALLQWRWDGQKRKCRVSLYGVAHNPDLDLSAIAKARGGGGHKQACGFECTWDEMGEILGG